MSEVLESWPTTIRVGRRQESWMDPYLDGRIHRLSGDDFRKSKRLATMRSNFYRKAKMRGLFVTVCCESLDPLIVIVQTFPREDSGPARAGVAAAGPPAGIRAGARGGKRAVRRAAVD